LKNVRILAGALLATTLIGLWGSAASAHVTVQPATAEKGARGRFVFRVPNESATASTVKLEAQMPKDKPLTGVRVMPKPGWTITMEKAKLDKPIEGEGEPITDYVSTITWTADPGVKIGPDQFDEFSFTTGPLPKDASSVAFKAVQTYDAPLADGSMTANWVEVAKEGQPAPKRPEAVVKLTEPAAAATGTATAVSAAATGNSESAAAGTQAATDAKSTADTAKTLGIIGLLLGLVALAVAIAAFVAKPKAKPATTTTGTGTGTGSGTT
jgi:periplasmic copper chaperone A